MELDQGKIRPADNVKIDRPKVIPYITDRGSLVIPFDSDPKYHYWAGGQSIEKTLLELKVPLSVWKQYSNRPYPGGTV